MYTQVVTLLWSTFYIEMALCSKVLDAIEANNIYVKEYCPKMQYCEDGAHVMCMYYNPKSVMGPRCREPRNVSMTSELAEQIITISNEFRSMIALGKERGKMGELLPKGYGMFRLNWDSELATFAQVLANQCVLRHDLCRATKKFPDPGQTEGLVRFSYPQWIPVSRIPHLSSPGLSEDKIRYATKQILKSWYSQKQHVTTDMLKSYPDWSQRPEVPAGRLYLDMVHGPVTHLGCGISAYREFTFRDKNPGPDYNTLEIICNFSSRPRKGTNVYNAQPPTAVGYTVRCGCPMGYDEDENCLCVEAPLQFSREGNQKVCDKGQNRKPPVVMLPIFTAEDVPAPTQQLRPKVIFDYSDILDVDNSSSLRIGQGPVDTILGALENGQNFIDHGDTVYLPRMPLIQQQTDNNTQLPSKQQLIEQNRKKRLLTGTKPNVAIRQRYFDKGSILQRHLNSQSQRFADSHVQIRTIQQPTRNSVFSRGTAFQLPGSYKKRENLKQNPVKKKVLPRKDFSNVRRVFNTYLIKKRNGKNTKDSLVSGDNSESHKTNMRATVIPRFRNKGRITTDLYQNESQSEPTNFNRYLKNKFHYQGFNTSDEPMKRFDIKNSDEDVDNKLMTLLDNLEQEVKRTELDVNEKEIFDVKIRKIYGSVVGNSAKLLKPINSKTYLENENNINYDNYETDVKNNLNAESVEDASRSKIEKRFYETEDEVKEAHSRINDASNNRHLQNLLMDNLLPQDGVMRDVKSGYINNRDFQEKRYDFTKKMNSRNIIMLNEGYDLKTQNLYDKNYNGKDYKEKRKLYNDNRKNPYRQTNNNSEWNSEHLDNIMRRKLYYTDNNKKEAPRYNRDELNSRSNYNIRNIASRQLSDEDSKKMYSLRQNRNINKVTSIRHDNNYGRNRIHYKDMDFSEKQHRFKEDRNVYKAKEDYHSLNLARRKYYQNKLDALERKVHNTAVSGRRIAHERERSLKLERSSQREELLMRPIAMN